MPRIRLFHLALESSRKPTGFKPSCGFLRSSRTTRFPASPAPTTITRFVAEAAGFPLACRASPTIRTDIRSPPARARVRSQSISRIGRAKSGRWPVARPIPTNNAIATADADTARATATRS
jgi:hypothetical protein